MTQPAGPSADEWDTLYAIRRLGGDILHRTDYFHGKGVGPDEADCEAMRAIIALAEVGPVNERAERIVAIARRLYSRHNPVAIAAQLIIDKCKALT